MKGFTRFLSFSSAALGLLSLLRLPSGPLLYLTSFKILAGALAPFVALAGAFGAALSWLRRERWATILGLVGAGCASWYTARLAAPQDPFRRSFGAGWTVRIPADLRRRMLPRPYTPLRLHPRQPDLQRNLTIWADPHSGLPLLADLWQPPQGMSRTGMAVIYLHSSAWHYLDKDCLTRPFFRYLAGQGHVALDLGYRLAPQVDLDGMLGDVKRAIAWIKDHACELGVNPARVVLVGASAGGHLALLAAYTPNRPDFQPPDLQADTSVCGVVSYYGISDLAAAHHYFQRIPTPPFIRKTAGVARPFHVLPPSAPITPVGEVVEGLMGASPGEASERYWRGSPVAHVSPHCPPTLLLHGAHDFGVDISQSRRLYSALQAAGVQAAYVELPSADHAFDLFFMEFAPAFQVSLYYLERFLALLI